MRIVFSRATDITSARARGEPHDVAASRRTVGVRDASAHGATATYRKQRHGVESHRGAVSVDTRVPRQRRRGAHHACWR